MRRLIGSISVWPTDRPIAGPIDLKNLDTGSVHGLTRFETGTNRGIAVKLSKIGAYIDSQRAGFANPVRIHAPLTHLLEGKIGMQDFSPRIQG
jgi:hypothetical protein